MQTAGGTLSVASDCRSVSKWDGFGKVIAFTVLAGILTGVVMGVVKLIWLQQG